MHLFYCDETNYDERKGDFLIYGGLIIPPEAGPLLSDAVAEITKPLPSDYILKFNPKPSTCSGEEFWQLKAAVLLEAAKAGAKLTASAVLHDIANDPDQARRNGINTVCLNFNGELMRTKSHGLVLIDRFNDKGNKGDKHIKTKFAVGLEGLPYSKTLRLDRILGLHYSAVGQSHFPSVIDIALGNLRFAFNAAARQKPADYARAEMLIQEIKPLFLGNHDLASAVTERGLQFSPKKVERQHFRDQYQRVKDRLDDWGLPTSQPITSQREY